MQIPSERAHIDVNCKFASDLNLEGDFDCEMEEKCQFQFERRQLTNLL